MDANPQPPSQLDRRRKPKAAAGPSRLLSAKQAAAHLGIAYTSLRDLAFRGEVPIVKFGNRWFFKREDLDRLIDSHTQCAG